MDVSLIGALSDCLKDEKRNDRRVEKLARECLEKDTNNLSVMSILLVSLVRQQKYEVASKLLSEHKRELLDHNSILVCQIAAHIFQNHDSTFGAAFFEDFKNRNGGNPSEIEDLLAIQNQLNELHGEPSSSTFDSVKNMLESIDSNHPYHARLVDCFFALSFQNDCTEDALKNLAVSESILSKLQFEAFINFLLAKIAYNAEDLNVSEEISKYFDAQQKLTKEEKQVLVKLKTSKNFVNFAEKLIQNQFQQTDKLLRNKSFDLLVEQFNASSDTNQKFSIITQFSENNFPVNFLANFNPINFALCESRNFIDNKQYEQALKIIEDLPQSISSHTASISKIKQLLTDKCSKPEDTKNTHDDIEVDMALVAQKFLMNAKKGVSSNMFNDSYIAKNRLKKKSKKSKKNAPVSKHWLSKHEKSSQSKKSKQKQSTPDVSSNYVKGTQGASVDEVKALELDMSKCDIAAVQAAQKRNAPNSATLRNRNKGSKGGKRR